MPAAARLAIGALAVAAMIIPGAWTAAASARPVSPAHSVSSVPAASPTQSATPSPSPKVPAKRLTPKQLAKLLMWQKFHWKPATQFHYLDLLWTKESRWNPRAYNPYTGAAGIPQAVPGSKMASAGPNWRTSARTQILWGLGYIKSRYGSPSAAWAHEAAHGWY